MDASKAEAKVNFVAAVECRLELRCVEVVVPRSLRTRAFVENAEYPV